MEHTEIADALVGHPVARDVDLLVLHGSRARGDAGSGSDWDVGFLGAADPIGLLTTLVDLLGTDAVDLVDLARAGAVLRFRAARDGVVLLEGRPDAFLDFRLDAVRFWCDAETVIRAAQAEVLASLDGPLR